MIREFCTFYLDQLMLGIDVLKIQEVLRRLDQTRVPLAPRTISGLINLRGQIVTAYDLRLCMGLLPRNSDECMNMVVHIGEGLVCLQVDHVGDVLEIHSDQIEPAPENLLPSVRRFIEGVCQLDAQLMLIMNPEKIVEA